MDQAKISWHITSPKNVFTPGRLENCSRRKCNSFFLSNFSPKSRLQTWDFCNWRIRTTTPHQNLSEECLPEVWNLIHKMVNPFYVSETNLFKIEHLCTSSVKRMVSCHLTEHSIAEIGHSPCWFGSERKGVGRFLPRPKAHQHRGDSCWFRWWISLKWKYLLWGLRPRSMLSL